MYGFITYRENSSGDHVDIPQQLFMFNNLQ